MKSRWRKVRIAPHDRIAVLAAPNECSPELVALVKGRSCSEKKRHLTKEDAIEFCDGDEGMKAYECPFCSGWHLASVKTVHRARNALKQAKVRQRAHEEHNARQAAEAAARREKKKASNIAAHLVRQRQEHEAAVQRRQARQEAHVKRMSEHAAKKETLT